MASTKVAVCQTSISSPLEAAKNLGASVKAKLEGAQPDVLIVFASPVFNYEALLQSLQEHCAPRLMVGCSSAGEFSGCSTDNASISVMAIHSEEIRFNAALGRGLRSHQQADAIAQLGKAFTADQHPDYSYRSAMILTDALAGQVEVLIHELTVLTGGSYQLFGGGAADDAKFRETHVFFGTEAFSDAVLVLEMLSKKPIGIGVKHGWRPNSAALRVTETEGTRIVSLNAVPAADMFEEHARNTQQVFDRNEPLPFFLHNILGIDIGSGDYKLRVPLALGEDGSVTCAAEVPLGSTVYIMTSNAQNACEAAHEAARVALEKLNGEAHAASLVFDCAATRLRLGRQFQHELEAIAQTLGSENFAGCNTYGQIARSEGQFGGFHNCTAVVCAIPV